MSALQDLVADFEPETLVSAQSESVEARRNPVARARAWFGSLKLANKVRLILGTYSALVVVFCLVMVVGLANLYTRVETSAMTPASARSDATNAACNGSDGSATPDILDHLVDSPLGAVLYIDAAKAGQVIAGQDLELRLLAYPHEIYGTLSATVTSVSPEK